MKNESPILISRPKVSSIFDQYLPQSGESNSRRKNLLEPQGYTLAEKELKLYYPKRVRLMWISQGIDFFPFAYGARNIEEDA